MKRILLDTSAYSAYFRGDEAVRTLLQSADEIALTPIVIGELLSGFAGGRRERQNRAEIQKFLSSPRVTILSIDEETAERYAVILQSLRKAGDPIPTNDIWISATAMQYGLVIATYDAHFAKVPQVVTELYGAS